MITWVLIIWIHAGVLADGNSMALTSIPGFSSEAQCMQAGQKAVTLTARTVKNAQIVCVQQGHK